MTKLEILIGDITQTNADIIVFSAHPSLLAGSGVSGAIHKAAGKELEAAAREFAPLKVSEAIITPAFELKSKYVIHTVCPRYIYRTDQEKEFLARAALDDDHKNQAVAMKLIMV
jgi:O-acetyl-ADP-ribose deacetylase